MRLFITGRIMKPTKRDIVVAYKIYDADTGRSGLYARSDGALADHPEQPLSRTGPHRVHQ